MKRLGYRKGKVRILSLLLAVSLWPGSGGAGTVALKSFRTSSGYAHIIVRDDGHLDSQPYVLEIRASCNPKRRSWRLAEVVEVESVCAVDTRSIRFDLAKETIAIQIKEKDFAYSSREAQKSPRFSKGRCEKSFITRTFELANVCP